tara:strand:+ start:330 stop:776 length:447 start_codon:yes stop_codon:yes gene_type:complete
MKRTTRFVQFLKENEVFVFGSNEAGRHGKGAAKLAIGWGACRGVGEGLAGSTYAIPTMDHKVRRALSVCKIRRHVQIFIEFAEKTPEKTFLVTEIGCGLASHTVTDIAPLFKDAQELHNVHLPASFWSVLASSPTAMRTVTNRNRSNF